MKKMFLILMMVFGLSAVFADTYVAFTSEEAFDEYCNSDHTGWDASQKAFFEETTADLSAKQKKRSSLILVCDSGNEGVIKNHILVYHLIHDPKAYGVIVFDDNFNIIVNSRVNTWEKTDPVMVGLSCLKEQVTHIVDIDNQKVIFESYNMVKE